MRGIIAILTVVFASPALARAPDLAACPRAAAAGQTESEFGSLNVLAVWRVDPVGTTEIGRIDELPRMHDWRMDGWSGETCIELSAVALDLSPTREGGGSVSTAAPSRARAAGI